MASKRIPETRGSRYQTSERTSMETHFQQELNELKSELLRMAGLAERAISNAIDALVKRDTPLAERTIREDVQINKLELSIDDRCLKLLALHQPMATDLRFITSAMRINIELERIGDLAVNIAERVISLNQEPQLKPYIDIPEMAEITQNMLRDVLNAFVTRDASLARSVCERDDRVDGLNNQVFRELLTYMMSDPKTITRAVHLLIVSRHLERIADHATNIAEGSSSWPRRRSSSTMPMQGPRNETKKDDSLRRPAPFVKRRSYRAGKD